jgi:hypothetical protein
VFPILEVAGIIAFIRKPQDDKRDAPIRVQIHKRIILHSLSVEVESSIT